MRLRMEMRHVETSTNRRRRSEAGAQIGAHHALSQCASLLRRLESLLHITYQNTIRTPSGAASLIPPFFFLTIQWTASTIAVSAVRHTE
jgi:hypothetical protein